MLHATSVIILCGKLTQAVICHVIYMVGIHGYVVANMLAWLSSVYFLVEMDFKHMPGLPGQPSTA